MGQVASCFINSGVPLKKCHSLLLACVAKFGCFVDREDSVERRAVKTVMSVDNLNILHGMCIVELRNLVENITAYEHKSTNILDKITESWHFTIENNNPEELIAYDAFCSNLSQITNLARKFNLHFRLHNLGSDEPTVFSEGSVQNSWDVGKKKPPGLALNSEPWNTHSQQNNYSQKLSPIEENGLADASSTCSVLSESPQIITNGQTSISANKEDLALAVSVNGQSHSGDLIYKDLSVYSKDSVLTATVTYIQDLNKLHFFVCDAGSDSIDTAKIAQLSKMKHLMQYGRFSIPGKGEIFGVVLDDIIVRAVRLDNKNNEILVLLLDLGEVTQISPGTVMYFLSPEYQELPAQAIPCVLLAEDTTDNSQLCSLLKSWEYQTLKLRVVRNDGKALYVQSLADVPNANVYTNQLCQLAPTNPFRQDILNGLEEKRVQMEGKADKLPLSSEPTAALPLGDSKKSRPNGLTPEELEMLYEETPCTSNAMKAVMGYNPKDDQRICRFYNPKTGSCFKGSSCRQEHTLLLKDGWTKDVQPISSLIDTRAPDTIYPPGTIISITPTYIGGLESFYCQINDPKLNTDPIIFADEDIVDMGAELDTAPLVFDLVLCRYQDGFWYRAKVMESDDVGKMFKVFYVDYGNSEIVHLRNLAKCDYGTAGWPFQAILCRLADVKMTSLTPEKCKEGTNTLRAHILNKRIDVKVVFHREELHVRIMDEQSMDLTKRLIAMGYFKPIK